MLKAMRAQAAAAGMKAHFLKKGFRPRWADAFRLGNEVVPGNEEVVSAFAAALVPVAAVALVFALGFEVDAAVAPVPTAALAAAIISCAVFFCHEAEELCRLARIVCSSGLKSSEKSSVYVLSRGPQ